MEKTEEGFIRMKNPGRRAMMESFHMLWGWMQIEDKIELYEKNKPRIPNLNNPKIKEWMRYHPHLNFDSPFLNTLFIGSKNLVLGSEVFEGLGCGTFPKYKDDLMLTVKG